MPEARTQFDLNWMESVQYTLEQISESVANQHKVMIRIADALEQIAANTKK